jgi:chloramphenicol 3-O-phosphotransferase
MAPSAGTIRTPTPDEGSAMRDDRLLSDLPACRERRHAARAKALAELAIDNHFMGVAMPDEEKAARKRRLIDRPPDLARRDRMQESRP